MRTDTEAAILVVDSDELVLDVTSAMLARSCFDVVTARSARSALDVLSKRPDIEIVLSEAVLPDISGLELVRAVQRHFPASAPMLMTAFTTEALDPAIPLLRKPFTVSELAGPLRRLLAQSREARRRLSSTLSKTRRTIERTREIRRRSGAGIFEIED